MPAASDPSSGLPRVWGPVGLRVISTVAFVAVIVMTLGVFIALGPELRTHFTGWQRLSTVGMFLVAGVIWWGLVRCSIRATVDGVVVTNGYRRYWYEWAEVVAVRFPPGAPWPTLDLSDGTTRMVLGLQASEGERTRRAVTDLRRILDERSAV